MVGGYISAHSDWRVIFWLLVGISLLICLMMQWKIQETLKPEHKQPLNLGQILKNYWGVLSHRGAMGYVLCGSLSSSGMFAFLSASPMSTSSTSRYRPSTMAGCLASISC